MLTIDRRTFALGASLATAATLLPKSAWAEDLWKTLPLPPAPIKPVSEGYVDLPTTRIWHAVYGAGPVVVLLHGGLGHSEVWGNQINHLAKTHTVVTMDSRGHGRSTEPTDGYSYAKMAEDVKAVLAKLGYGPSPIIGWSDGGIIGLELAMAHPGVMSKGFLFGANYDLSGLKDGIDKDPVFSNYIGLMAEDYKKLSTTPDKFDAFVGNISKMWYSEPNYKPEQLAKITTPVVISDGAYDEAIRQEHTAAMAKAIPGAKLLIMKDVSHFAMWQDPAQFNAAMDAFLAG
jgi:pimeloyl-ACP methyl ester carboxylesterase